MNERILHHKVAVELTEEMMDQVSGGTDSGGLDPSAPDGSKVFYSTSIGDGLGCKQDVVFDC